MKKNKTLLDNFKKQIAISSVIAVFCSLLIIVSVLVVARNHDINSERKRISNLLSQQLVEMASQVLIYDYHELPVPSDFANISKKIHPNAIIGIKSPDGKCILGDCSVFDEDKDVIAETQKIEIADEFIGIVGVKSPKPDLDLNYLTVLISTVLVILAVFVVTIYFLSLRFFRRKVITPLDQLSSVFTNFDYDSSKASLIKPLINSHDSEEFFALFNSFDQMSNRIQNLAQTHQKLAIHKAESELASQVAHDIRSPLSALEMIAGMITEVPEEKRTLLRNAVNRIRDIANTLIQKKSTALKSFESDSKNDSTQVELLLPILDSLITEKRIQFRDKLNIQINLIQNSECYGLFSAISTNEFKRLVSNLVNNSVESFKNNGGKVSISMFSNRDMNQIEISDNGAGIPPEILVHLGQRGFSYNKEGGSGLGLHHAKVTVEKWGGDLQVNSKIDVGTKVLISLPSVASPIWFVPELKLYSGMTLVVFDDDQSIHQIWADRIENLSKSNVKLIHLSTPDEFRVFCKKMGPLISNKIRFLVDYEFINHTVTGLDLIQELQIQTLSYLVTSRYEENAVRATCDKLGVKLIPKTMSAFIPITL